LFSFALMEEAKKWKWWGSPFVWTCSCFSGLWARANKKETQWQTSNEHPLLL